MNLWDVLILAVLAFAVGLAVRRIIRQRRSGGCGCCGNPDCKKRRQKP